MLGIAPRGREAWVDGCPLCLTLQTAPSAPEPSTSATDRPRQVLPDYILAVMLIILLAATAQRTLKKGFKTYNKETLALQVKPKEGQRRETDARGREGVPRSHPIPSPGRHRYPSAPEDVEVFHLVGSRYPACRRPASWGILVP